jgi:putative transferase (TIGR04331 family)
MLLVTTGLTDTWGIDEEILFLGEWCKTQETKASWEKRKFVTLPYIWENRKQMAIDSVYLRNLNERILISLVQNLNNIHNCSYSVRFWRILIGIWLGFFIHISYHRWVTIETATKKYKNLYSLILKNSSENKIPNDVMEFVSLMTSDYWNHELISSIIKFQNKIKWEYINIPEINIINPKNLKNSRSYKSILKERLVKSWNLLFSLFTKDNDIFFINTYLPLIEEIKLNLRFKQPPMLNFSNQPSSASFNPDMRNWNFEFNENTDFEKFLSKMIPLYMPKAYLEGFSSLENITKNLKWPQAPKLIFTSNSHIFEDLTKFWIANKVERGSKLVIGQHGGGPLFSISFQTEFELEICDKLLTTGEGNSYHHKMKPVGQFFRRKWKCNPKGNGLLVELAAPYYTNSYQSTIQSTDYLRYQEEQYRFIDLLDEDIKTKFLIRLHRYRNGWNNSQIIWKNKYPNLRIDFGYTNIFSLFNNSRIIVCTYPGTSYNESLAANAPTIIFWNSIDSQLHESSNSSFDELRHVGIFHDTPESAASHLNKIWNNIEEWWNQQDVKKAVSSFTRKYCFIPSNMVNNLEIALKEVILS